MNQWLTLKFYLDARPNPDFQYTKLTLALIVVLFAAGIVLGLVRRRVIKNEIWKKILKKYPAKLRYFALALLLLLLFRETDMPYFSMRLWWAIWAILLIYSVLKFLLTFRKEYARRKARLDQNKRII